MWLPGTRVRVIIDGIEEPDARYEVEFRQKPIELAPADASDTLPSFVGHLWPILEASALPGPHAVFRVRDDACVVVGDLVLDARGDLEWRPAGGTAITPEAAGPGADPTAGELR